MRKIVAAGVLGLAVAMVPLSGAQATTERTVWRAHYTTAVECAQMGKAIVNSSPKVWGYQCVAHNLGGFDLYLIY
ncbi:hypothetical protein [Virgisporangium aurantiacum]|uniref:Secreted protein n=1 Tax=Virgisporangium aurantiacum TaxID=175570 RepID=A0A8J3ZIT4_9ACTN|nr:hypothetical protein [Virgisporangium aurantiacum]GIJ62183.1 hypothetical protein Vau01_096990 [Virgisporangium aurantiacum]